MLFLAPAAEAKWLPLTEQDGRAALGRAYHRLQAWGENDGHRISKCYRLSVRTINCWVLEYGVEWDGSVGTMSTFIRAQRRTPNVVIVYDTGLTPMRFARPRG